MNNKRIDWLDIAKAFGMILVILGHCVTFDGWLHIAIFSFHMPLFFVLSGITFKNDSFFVILKKKIKTLLVPYLIFFVIGYVLAYLFTQSFSLKALLVDIYTGNPSYGWTSSIWFLLSLFVVTMLFSLILKIPNKGLQITVVVSLLLLGFAFAYVYNNYSVIPHRLPLELDSSMISLSFFAFGYYMKDFLIDMKEKIEKKVGLWSFGLLAVLLAIDVLLVFLNKRVNVQSIIFNNPLFFILNALNGTLILIFISQFISKYSVFSFLKTIGQETLIMLPLQAIGIRLYIFLSNLCFGTTYQLYYLEGWQVFFSFVSVCSFTIVLALVYKTTIKRLLRRQSNEKM